MYITSSHYGFINNVTITTDDSIGYIHINLGGSSVGLSTAEAAKLAAELAAAARKQVESTHAEVAA